MIEHQTIDGRKATVAYMTADFYPADRDSFDVAKIIFDDGGIVFVSSGDAAAEMANEHDADAWNRNRQRAILPYIDYADGEAGGFGKHRQRHKAPLLFSMTDPELPEVPTEDVVEPPVREVESDQPVAHQLAAWAKAVVILDASEVLIRDVIERELVNVLIDKSNDNVNLYVDRIMAAITEVRTEAVKTAFRLVRDRLGDRPIADVSLARWAASFLAADLKNIEMAIRAGIVDGLDGTEVARKVVGSMGLNGVDGVTEFTRLKVAHLGRAAIRATAFRKMGVENP